MEFNRDIGNISHNDIYYLRFFRNISKYVFRKHHYQGLRSHVFQILKSKDVQIESSGININGFLQFPKAKPVKMLRIFRTRFDNLNEILEETSKYALMVKYLGENHLAKSQEVIVSDIFYKINCLILIGFQEYVEGLKINPWNRNNRVIINEHFKKHSPNKVEYLWSNFNNSTANFVSRLKHLIIKKGCVPDLSGKGNIILTKQGVLKLVDINNISKILNSKEIITDEFGYPVIEKSIEAMFFLEKRLIPDKFDKDFVLYKEYLNTERMKRVKDIENRFNKKLNKYSSFYY